MTPPQPFNSNAAPSSIAKFVLNGFRSFFLSRRRIKALVGALGKDLGRIEGGLLGELGLDALDNRQQVGDVLLWLGPLALG